MALTVATGTLMQTRITPEEIQAAARQLAKSERGRQALQRLAELIDADALHLDFLDQRAFLALLGGVWTGQAGPVREAVRAAESARAGNG